VLDTDEVRWTHIVDGLRKEKANYMTTVHAAIGRACVVAYKAEYLDYEQMVKMEHSTNLMCGTYYIRTEVNDTTTSKIFIHCQVPPVDAYSVPYSAPSRNVHPTPHIQIYNIVGGGGSWGDPYVISGTTVYFRINGSYDGNGSDDLKYGAWYWAIVTDGWHPIYSNGEQLKDIPLTFSHYDEINDLQKWNTQERPSSTGNYRLTLYLYDRHGYRSTSAVHFISDGINVPLDSEPPTPPSNLNIVAH
jgi:hypothetical protein